MNTSLQYSTGEERRNSSRRNEEVEPKRKKYPVVDVSGSESEVWYCKEQYCKGSWNIRSINWGKFVLKHNINSSMMKWFMKNRTSLPFWNYFNFRENKEWCSQLSFWFRLSFFLWILLCQKMEITVIVPSSPYHQLVLVRIGVPFHFLLEAHNCAQ